MKKYDIEIEEILQRVVTVEADSYEDAENIIDEKITNCEIVLDESDYKDRTIRNFVSRELDKPLEILMVFNPSEKELVIESDAGENKYFCRNVSDLNYSFKFYINDYLEENEIEKDTEIEMERW